MSKNKKLIITLEIDEGRIKFEVNNKDNIFDTAIEYLASFSKSYKDLIKDPEVDKD